LHGHWTLLCSVLMQPYQSWRLSQEHSCWALCWIMRFAMCLSKSILYLNRVRPTPHLLSILHSQSLSHSQLVHHLSFSLSIRHVRQVRFHSSKSALHPC
jgi:hypothetical protein